MTHLYDAIGLVGVVCLLLAYFLLQTRRVHSEQLTYLLLNLFGASGILISLVNEWNLSAFVIEACWVLISLYGILKVVQGKSREPNAKESSAGTQ